MLAFECNAKAGVDINIIAGKFIKRFNVEIYL